MTAALKNPEKELQGLMPYVTKPMAAEMLMKASNPAVWLMYAVLADTENCIKLSICHSEAAEEAEAAEAEEVCAPADPELLEKLRNNLGFRYARAAAEALPSKVTATEMKHYDAPDAEAVPVVRGGHGEFRSPDFLRAEKPLSGAEKGTATHMVLQFIDYAKTGSIAEIKAEIERLRVCRFISDRQAEAVNANAIFKLFSSEIGARIRNADSLRREFKFSLLCPAEDFFDGGEGEKVLLQGVMDCCIEENGELTVIDYKTDRVRGEALKERAELYAGQVRAYAMAAGRIMGKPVRECVLYFLDAGEEVTIKI